jgi:hypothetical protein
MAQGTRDTIGCPDGNVPEDQGGSLTGLFPDFGFVP